MESVFKIIKCDVKKSGKWDGVLERSFFDFVEN